MSLFASLALLLAVANAPAETASATREAPADHQSDDAVEAAASEASSVAEVPSSAARHHLRRGVLYGGMFGGERAVFVEEAMQEAWTLMWTEHPEAWSMDDATIRTTVVPVTRRGGTVRDLPLDQRLFELGAKARNTVLRDNHLSRQVMRRPVQFTEVEPELGYQLRYHGTRTAPKSTEA